MKGLKGLQGKDLGQQGHVRGSEKDFVFILKKGSITFKYLKMLLLVYTT